MDVLLVGCGALGTEIARIAHAIPEVGSLTLLDRRREPAETLARALPGVSVAAHLAEGLRAADVVVEAASLQAVAEFAPRALEAGKDVVVLSVGALLDPALRASLEGIAKASGARMRVPSGALAGLDALRAASMGRVDAVRLTTTKPPAALGLDLSGGASPKVLFEGSARDAVAHFPRNVNVAAAAALACPPGVEPMVRIVADPAATRNTHVLEVDGDFGTLRVEVANAPSPGNASSSLLAARSAAAMLRGMAAPLGVA